MELRVDPVVKEDEVELRVSVVGPEDLFGIGDLHRQRPAGAPRRLRPAHGRSAGRRHSPGFLSSRRPRKTGWRSFPSSVHSWNATCATSFGSNHVAPFSRGGWEKGGS